MPSSFSVFAYSVVGLFLGITTFFVGLLNFKRKRLIENIPTSKIRSLAMGLVEICGEAVPVKNSNMISPFTRKRCVYYRYTIERLVNSGKYSRWVKVKAGHEGDFFFVRDDTGTVLVSTKGAIIDVGKKEFDSSFGKKPNENITKFLSKHEIKTKDFFGFGHRMRFREYIIEPGDKVYVMGSAGDNPFLEDATSVYGVNDVMIKKGKNDKIFYISDKSEKDIIKTLRSGIFIKLFGGGALSVGCLWVILIYLGLF